MTRGQLAVGTVGGLALVLAAALGYAMQRGVGKPPLGTVDAGFTNAPTFELPRLDAGTFALAEHQDRPVFLYFWASWCGPCRLEAPVIQRLWPEYQAKGYTFVGVNVQDLEGDARNFVKEFGLTFPIVRDEGGSVYLDYGVYGLPESFFMEPGLRVKEKYLGEITEDVLRSRLAGIERSAVRGPAS